MTKSSSISQKDRLIFYCAAALLVTVTLAIYYPALRAGFIWDDDTMLTNNRLIRAADGLHRFWFSTEPTDYWPITSTSFWLEWRLWGMHAAGYHVTNVGLHIVGSLLLWAILLRLKMPGAYLAAALFAVHPINVESVAWIAERKDLLATVFFLTAILFFLRAESEKPGSRGWHGLSLFAFLLGMLSKGSVAMLPLVLLGLLAWRRPPTLQDVLRLAPYFIVGGVFTLVDIWFQRHGAAIVIREAGLVERALGAGAVIWFYLGKILFPINLTFVYPQWHIHAGNPLWWVPLLAAVSMTAVLWHGRQGWSRPWLFAWGYFCVMLVPVMGLTDVYFMKYSLVADHYAHLAIIGVVAILASGWNSWSLPTPATRLIACAVVSTLGALTWRQCLMYRDSETLFQTTLMRNPEAWLAHNNLGELLLKDPLRMQDSIQHFQMAMQLDPRSREPRDNLGDALTRMGRPLEAIDELQKALRIDPADAVAHIHLGNALFKLERIPEAISHYEQALKIDPNRTEAHHNLGLSLERRGDFFLHDGHTAEARESYEGALRADPGLVRVHNNLGNLYFQSGQVAEAISLYESALNLDPGYLPARENLLRAKKALQLQR